MFRKAIYILCVVAILVAVNNIEKASTNGEERLLTAFNQTNFALAETDLHVWGEYSKSFMTDDAMKEIGRRIAREVGLRPSFQEDFFKEEMKKVYTIEKKTKEADTTIKVVELVEKVANNSLKVENYIVVNVVLHEKCQSVLYFRDKIREVFDKYDIYGTDNLTVTSIHAGRLNEEQAKLVVEQIVKTMDCKVRDTFKTDDIYSIYGYSGFIDNHILSDGKRINVDLALTYNEVEDVTYLYAAIPVITIDY